MAIAYLCLFTAFQTTQILAAALLGNLGTIAIGVLYLCFVGSGFFAPVIARKLGPVRGLIFGGCTYVLFMLSFIYMVAPIVLLCACIIGCCGASILWCSQGMITQCTTDCTFTRNLPVLANEYRRQHGAALRPLDYGFTALTPLLETLHSTCTLVFPGIGVTEVAPALRHNSAAYNIAGGVPDARLSVPVDSSDSRGRTSRWWAVRVIHGLRSD